MDNAPLGVKTILVFYIHGSLCPYSQRVHPNFILRKRFNIVPWVLSRFILRRVGVLLFYSNLTFKWAFKTNQTMPDILPISSSRWNKTETIESIWASFWIRALTSVRVPTKKSNHETKMSVRLHFFSPSFQIFSSVRFLEIVRLDT